MPANLGNHKPVGFWNYLSPRVSFSLSCQRGLGSFKMKNKGHIMLKCFQMTGLTYPWWEHWQRSWVDKCHQGLADPCLGGTVRNKRRWGPEGWGEQGPFLIYYCLELKLLWLWAVQRVTQRGWIPAHLPSLSSVLWHHSLGRKGCLY